MLTRRNRRGVRPNKSQKDEAAIAAGWRMILATINDCMVMSAAALHDEFGFGEQRTKRFLDRFSEIFEACIQEGDMLDVQSIETVLKQEGIKCIEYHKYDFMKVEKEKK